MKPTMALKPLVFALAAVMAMAAQAGGQGGHNPPPPQQASASTTATAQSSQYNGTNVVNEQGTVNNGSVNDSLNSSSGSIGANSAAGSDNQQSVSNSIAAQSSSDEDFVFGNSNGGVSAAAAVTQTNYNNYSNNNSTLNNASVNSSGNNSSGIIAINSSAGNSNQQGIANAIASGTGAGQALASASQSTTNNVTENNGTATYKKDTLTGTFTASGEFVAAGVAKSKDDSHDSHGGWGNNKGGKGDTSGFVAAGDLALAGTTTQQVLVPTGWVNPVTNNASINGSGNSSSGLISIQSAAGYNNMQSITNSVVSH